MILKEIDDPSVHFTASFGPNCRIRNEVAALSKRDRARYVKDMFVDTENIAALPWIQNEGPGSKHADKKDLVDILLT